MIIIPLYNKNIKKAVGVKFPRFQIRVACSLWLVARVFILFNMLYVIQPGNVFFMHMILMDSVNELAMNLRKTYLVTENGNERLDKQKLDLVVL